MKQKLALLLLLLILSSITFNAQEKCGFETILSATNANSDSKTQFDSIRARIRAKAAAIRGASNPNAKVQQNSYVIPVVVHLVGNNPSAMTDAQVLAQINLLNTAFSNSLGSISSSADDAQIKFCLAQKLPDGTAWSNISNFNPNLFYNSTSGISRCTTAFANNLTVQHNMSVASSFGQQSLVNVGYGSFNSNNYLNIWVVEQISETDAPYYNYVVGYAPFPLMGNAAGLDGVVMRLDGFGINSGGLHYNQGRTLIHETGHYLGLFHTFQNGCSEVTYSLTCNTGGDECCDTPPVASANQNNCSVFASTPPNSCSESPNLLDMYENHMDYAYDMPGTCRNTFTNDQVDRMHASIQLYRANLVAYSNHVITGLTLSGGCQANAINPGFATNLPNASKQFCTGQSVGFLTGSAASTYSWTFSGATPSVAVGTYSPTGIVYNAAGVYTVTLNITDVSGNNYNSSMQVYVSNCNAITSNSANWYFGYFESVSFATGIAVSQPPSGMITHEASACISNSSGNLLFYTDGRSVLNNTHGAMVNGGGTLNGSPNAYTTHSITSAAQGVVIVPRPSSPNKYFVYTTSDIPTTSGTVTSNISNGISQYEVDMTTSTGSVVSTIPTYPTNNYATNEPIIAVPHCNGTDYWLVVKPRNNNQNGLPNPGSISAINQYIASYSVTSAGISNTPVLSPSSPYIPSTTITGTSNDGIGQIAISPDKSIIAFADCGSSIIYLFYFDCSTGKTNYLTTLTGVAGYGLAFSPNSKVLYVSGLGYYIRQFDLSNISVCNTPPYVDFDSGIPSTGISSLRLAPDGRIYGSHMGRNFLSVINFPNIVNFSAFTNNCGYNPSAVSIANPNYTAQDLPNDINSKIGQTNDDFSYCVANCSQGKFANLGCGTNFSWNFGDGYTASGTNTVIPAGTNGGTTSGNFEYPIHTYSATGTYVVSLSIDGRTSVTHTVTFAAPPTPAISGSTLICSTNTTTPATYNGPAGYTYNWWTAYGSPFAGTQQSINVSWLSFPAVLSLTVTNGAGCTSSSSITVNSTNNYTASTSQSTICSTSPTTLTATGTASYTWQPTGLIGNTVVVNPSTTTIYTVTGLTPNLCSITNTVAVTVLSTPTLAVNNSTICIGTSTILTASGADTYSWSTSANTNSISVTPTVTTTYTVSGTNTLTGCTTATTVQVTVAPNPTISVTNPTICANGTSTLVVASGANTYTWSTGAISNFISVTAPTVTTTYTVVGTKTLTGCTNTAVATVVVNPLPNATLTPNGSISLCGSQTITLNANSDADPNSTYAWTHNSSTSVGTGHSINVSLSGNYQVLITNTITGCVKTYSTPVYIAPTYVCNQCLVPNGDFEYYANLTNGLSNIVDAPFWNAPTVGTPDYYNTNSTNLTTIPNNGFTSSTPDHTGNSSQGYAGFINYDLNQPNQREYIQTPLNCSLEPNQVYNVSIWARAASLLKYTSNNIGLHLSINAITGSTNLFSFAPQLNFNSVVPANTWSQLTGTVTGNNENYITIGNFKNDANTTFTLSNPGGIGGGTAYYFVDDVSIVPVAPSYTASTTSCITSGSAVTLTLSGSPGYYITNGVTTQTLNAATGTIAISPTVTTTYTINPILVCNKCNVFSTITVSVSPSVTLSASNSTLCSGNSSILTASGATTYSWNTGATTNSISVSPLTTTVYTVTGTTGGCTNTKTITITVNTTPTVSVNNATICTGTSTVLTASGATSYSWSTGATTNTISVSPTSTTIYTVTGTSNGCSNTKTVSVTVKTTPTVTVNSPTICSGQTTTLTASGATTYSWNTSATTSSIAVSPASTTNYTVTGTTNGCSNTKTVNVTVNPSPTLTAVANPTSICVGQTATLTAGGATTYSWSTASTNTVITVTPSTTTTYTVYGFFANGCSSTKTITVIVGPATPTITASSSSVAVCSGGSATLTASGASNYTWSPIGINTSTAIVTPTAAIIYTLSGSYGSGCNTATTTLLVNPIISTLCCTAPNSSITTSTIASGTYNNSGTVIDVQGVITFTGNTTFNGYTFRMKPNTLLRVMGEYTLTLNNCKLFSCSELWNGIELVTENSDDHGHLALNNTTIEDMYNGIFMDGLNLRIDYPMTNAIITSTASILNKNYTSIQFKNIDGMFNVATMTPTNVPYPFSMITTTLSSYSSTSSPGSALKPSSTYTYAYNDITNGTMGGSAPYLNFPRAYIGISLNNLRAPSSFLVGNNANAAHTNVFDNLDFGINASNAKLEAYNNYFKNITGSIKQGDITIVPTQYYASGPDEIGIAIAATHTTLNTFDINVGYNLVLPTGGNPFPRGNKFENCNRAIKAINCNNAYVMANTFTASTTSLPVVTTTGSPPYQIVQPNPNTYYYYSAQSAIFVSGLSNNMEASYNDIKNYGNGIYSNYTSNSVGTGVKIYTNNIASPSTTGYCMQAIQVDQSGGFTTASADIIGNTITNVYKGMELLPLSGQKS